MKRTGLILLACLTLALQAVAQAPEKPAPDDLVVTAQIVSYIGYDVTKSFANSKVPDEVMLIVNMTVRNMTDHSRDIFMMDCDWPNSWVSNGPTGLAEVTIQPGCDKNSPQSYTIPPHEALIFDCRLLCMRGRLVKRGEKRDPKCFQLGFLDFASRDDVWIDATENIHTMKTSDRVKNARAIYWSNILTNEVFTPTTKAVMDYSIYPTFRLTWEDR